MAVDTYRYSNFDQLSLSTPKSGRRVIFRDCKDWPGFPGQFCEES